MVLCILTPIRHQSDDSTLSFCAPTPKDETLQCLKETETPTTGGVYPPNSFKDVLQTSLFVDPLAQKEEG